MIDASVRKSTRAFSDDPGCNKRVLSLIHTHYSTQKHRKNIMEQSLIVVGIRLDMINGLKLANE